MATFITRMFRSRNRTITGRRAGGIWPPGINLIGPCWHQYIQATSTTSLGIVTGPATFITQAGLAYSVGARARATSNATPTNWIEGLVTSYSATTLIINVDLIGGSGTAADWNINIAGNPGQTGPSG